MQTEKALYEAAIANEFQAVLEGIWQTEKQSEKVVTLAKQVAGVDESLLKAMPSTCLKKADARSQFDNMVLETIARNFADRVASLTTTLKGAKVSSAEHTASVQAAQAAVEASKAKQHAAATNVSTAQASHREAQVALSAAETALSEFESTLLVAEEVAGQHKAALDNFEMWNVSCFEMMRDKARKPDPVEQATPAVEVALPAVPTAETALVEEVVLVPEVVPGISSTA